MSQAVCAACRRAIDASAKLCPYCGANPVTGERVDTQAILQEIFRPREVTTSQSVLEYARQRQGIVIAVSVAAAFLVLAGLHQFVTMRNDRAVTDSAAVPLTEIADLANQIDESKPQPMPQLDFQYDGKPQAMRTYIVESGAVMPAGPVAPPSATATAPGAQPPARTPAPARPPR
jgi:hypothetical protein